METTSFSTLASTVSMLIAVVGVMESEISEVIVGKLPVTRVSVAVYTPAPEGTSVDI